MAWPSNTKPVMNKAASMVISPRNDDATDAPTPNTTRVFMSVFLTRAARKARTAMGHTTHSSSGNVVASRATNNVV